MRILTVSGQHSRFLYLLVAVSLLLGLVGPTQVLPAHVLPQDGALHWTPRSAYSHGGQHIHHRHSQ